MSAVWIISECSLSRSAVWLALAASCFALAGQEGWHFSCDSDVNAAVRETIMERWVYFQSSD